MPADDEQVAEPEPEPEHDNEEKQKQRRKEDALKEKEQGNAAYKARKFDEAISHYDKAYDLYDEDISFLTNRFVAYCMSFSQPWHAETSPAESFTFGVTVNCRYVFIRSCGTYQRRQHYSTQSSLLCLLQWLAHT